MLKSKMRSIITLVLIVALSVPFFATTVSAEYENTYTNTGNMRDDIIGVALTQVGYTEGSNNYTKYGVWFGMSNAPWCGIFVSWCANEAGIPTSVLRKNGLANPSNFGLSYVDGADYTPQKGDLFFKKGFSHVGLVYYTEGDYFYTLEGNTSTTSYDGNCVMIRKRKTSDFYFSTPNYSGTSNSGCSHEYETKIESEHPHKEFKTCSKCSHKSYTGNKITNDNCITCIQEACDHSFGQWKCAGDNNHSRVCSNCDLEESKPHNWEVGKVLTEATCTDEGKQQIICTECNEESSRSIAATGEHIYTDFSYIDEENHQKVCSMCEEQQTALHTLSEDWQHDNLYHWTSCTDCGGHIRHLEHVFSNGCMEPCNICGYTLNTGHKTDGKLEQNSEKHWETCIRCGEATNVHLHNYTTDCDETCNTCGYVRAATVPHKDTYQADESGHQRTCSNCGRVTEKVCHTPDLNTKDWENQLCTHCGFELRSADAHIHVHGTVQSDATTHWGTCPCGEILKPEAHSWDFKSGMCAVCGIVNTHEDDKAPDNFFIKILNQLLKK